MSAANSLPRQRLPTESAGHSAHVDDKRSSQRALVIASLLRCPDSGGRLGNAAAARRP